MRVPADFVTLRLFVDVCETGSLAGAADRASVVSSAVSKRLAQLEDEVGAVLLTRKRHGMVPTAAGAMLLEHARSLLHGAERMRRDMKTFAEGGSGHVRILASFSAMSQWMARDIAAFLKQAPNRGIHVDIEEQSTPAIIHGIHEGLASIGVCWDKGELRALQMRPYRQDHLCVAVPVSHILSRRKALRFEETLEFEQVGLPVNTTMQLLLGRLAAQAGRPLRSRIVARNHTSSLHMVGAGLAIAIVPREAAWSPPESLGVRLIELEEEWATRQFVVCYRNEEALTPAAAQMVKHLAALDVSNSL